MTFRDLKLTVLALFGLAVALLCASGASASSAPWVIVANTRLTSDHEGPIVIGASGITLDCVGHSLTGPGFAGVTLQDVTGVTVKNCRASGFEVGFFVYSAPANRLNDNVSAENNHDGFVLASSPSNDHNVLTGNVSSHNGGWGFAVYDGTTDTTLKSNAATANSFAGFFVGLGSIRTQVVGNSAQANPGGFDIDSDANYVAGNTAKNNNGLGFFIFQASENAFAGNTSQDNVGGYLVVGSDIHESSHNSFTGNVARGNAQVGFSLARGASSTRLIGNSASDNSGDGFQLDSISDNLLTGNEAAGNHGHGFGLSSVSGGSLSTNRSYDNGGLGFLLASSNGNTLTLNVATGNALAGFRSNAGSSGNTFSRNLSTRNLNGFVLITSSHETLEHNLAARNNGDGFGLVSSVGNQLTENIGEANGNIGFELFSGSTGNTVRRNSGHANAVLDARDENPAGTNEWLDNSFGSSSLP